MNVQPFIQDSLIYLTDTLQAGVPAFEAYQTYCDRLAVLRPLLSTSVIRLRLTYYTP